MDECAIVGYGMAQATLEEIAQLRKDPGPARPKAMENQVLKHADEQTVLALAAMLKGVAAFSANYEEWAIVAAPRWPGRLGTAHALDRYHTDGPRGVSPLAIPNVCLHSLSATVSLAFSMRGPNFGVGGGLAHVADGLLAGLGVQLEHQPPGTWVIFTEWNDEPGQFEEAPSARALALALRPVSEAPAARRLILRPGSQVPSHSTTPRLGSLVGYLLDPNPTPWICALDWGTELVLRACA